MTQPANSAKLPPWALVVMAAVAVAVCIITFRLASDDSREKAALESARPVAVLQAAALDSEYSSNEIAANEKYRGKLVEIQGEIQEISAGLLGSPYILLLGKGHSVAIQCQFNADDKAWLAGIKKGGQVKVYGRVVGKLVCIQLSACQLRLN